MGLFDDLLAKATELTGIINQDATSRAYEETTSQFQDQIASVSEELPADPQDTTSQLFDDQNKET